MRKPLYLLLSVVFCLLIACQKDESNNRVTDSGVFISKDSDETGLNFANQLNENSGLNIIEYLYYYNGAGIGVGDINNDGLEDVFIARTGHQFWRNDGAAHE